ncbi:cytochrome P450 [Panus rudis PR-1116 ss-1]|nr:cytochrome P450 [Panus rudis PR-1116 ss-1]
MHSSGVLPLFQAFLADGAALSMALTLPVVVLLLFFRSLSIARHDEDDSPITLPASGLFTIAPFFRSRFDFLTSSFKLSGRAIFQFNLWRATVIAVSGDVGRREFFTSKGLDINEGFKFLSGAIPMLPGVTSDLQSRRISLIHKRLSAAQNSEQLSRLLPKILADSDKVMHSWGQSGTLDPFESIPRLIFQTTVRSLASSELADDEVLVARLKELYDELDVSTTPASVLFPWFPSPSMVRKLLATKKIYDIVNHAIETRANSGLPGDDTLQLLLDSGDDRLVVLGFIMGLLVAGARSTGTTASWLLTFLTGHPEWKSKAEAEVRKLIHEHSAAPGLASSATSPSYPVPTPCLDSNSDSSHPSQHPSVPAFSSPSFAELSNCEKLSSIPLEAWESETPVLDALIRETLRVAQPHTAMRRNMGPDTFINGTKIPSGAYVVYPFSDVHLNPELYPDPWKFDPARPEHKMPMGYVGWGGGRVTCLGQRLAKLELKLVTSLFLLEFSSGLVDKSGRVPDPLPRPNWNDALFCKPPAGSCFIQYAKDPCTIPSLTSQT